ncbi:MAG: T9SS type A sorting domain-containing protein [Saprospiraceae bacterium]
MNSKICILFLSTYFITCSEIFSQREDYHWMLGYCEKTWVDTNFGRAEFIFNDSGSKITKTYSVKHKLDFTNASICDSLGKMLFYTNGLEVYNRDYEIMPNGDDLNPGEFANGHENDGYPLECGAMILPYPSHQNKFFLIHHTIDRIPYLWNSLNLLTTLVDMNLDQGMGDVIYKNHSIYQDSLMLGNLTACRHANGRDWWIPIFYYRGMKCFMFLLDPSGLRLHHIQEIPFEFSISGSGQAQFSPNGRNYVFFNQNSQGYKELFISFFDRCTGEFYDPSYYTMPKFELVGVAFSPNSKYLYLSTGYDLYQLNMNGANAFENKLKVDSIDGFQSFPGFPSYFYLMQHAPDGKIYICNGRSPTYLSTIENPDNKGKECNVKQHNISIVANSTMPNFPFFRLGALKGSLCDSIRVISKTSDDLETTEDFSIIPNPNHGSFTIQLDGNNNTKARLMIYNFNGQLMYETSLRNDSQSVNVNLSSGIYLVKVIGEKSKTSVQKLIIRH